MILGLGVDLVEIARIKAVLTKYPERFPQKVFTAAERNWLKSKLLSPERAAALFAAKEACSKALGTGLRGISWQEMEVFHEDSGRPRLKLTGNALKRFLALGGKGIHLSLSHEKGYALAVVIIEGEPYEVGLR